MKEKLPTLKQLLEAGVHFGHRKERWNPKMKPFVFTTRDNVSIINLEKTQEYLEKALDYVEKLISENKTILFVGSKKQVQNLIKEVVNLDLPYINHRWLGGTLTNFDTIKKTLKKFKQMEKEYKENQWKDLTKFEQSKKIEELKKLEKKFGGIKNMEKLPDALFVVDTLKEKVAIREANYLNIPIIALVDTNSDPEKITYPIPANDDAVKSLELLLNLFFDKIKTVREKINVGSIKNKPQKTKVKSKQERKKINENSK